MPKITKAANALELKDAFESHLEETKGQVERLEKIFEELELAQGKKCKAMEGLVEERSDAIKEDAEPQVKDAGLIAAAQRVRAKRLQDTLDEEGAADEKLTELANSVINIEAIEA